jgi:NAD(P)-dependent dehydrogenase (short-subunit alcohol dehydrogenase family)
MTRIIVITGAGSGFGALTARALADQGDTVFAGMRDTTGRNQTQVDAANAYATEHHVDLRPVELDVNSQASVDEAIAHILNTQGCIDVVIHNAGHMVVGPAEAFTPEQLDELFNVNVLSTQRLNRAVLPHLRQRGQGLVIWVSSSSVKGGTPPYLAPYFAAKAAEDSLAVSYAAELARFGVETTIVVPGSFTTGTNHFAHSGRPTDTAVEAEYELRYPPHGLGIPEARCPRPRWCRCLPGVARDRPRRRITGRAASVPHPHRPRRRRLRRSQRRRRPGSP